MKKIIILCFVLFFITGCAKQTAAKTGDIAEETHTVSSAPVSSETEPATNLPGSSEVSGAQPEVLEVIEPGESTPEVSHEPSQHEASPEMNTPVMPTTSAPADTPSPQPPAASNDAMVEDARCMLTETLQENAEILMHYANAKAGGLVILFGLEENMNKIKTAANTAAEKTSKCQTQGQSCCNIDVLRRCYEESENIQLRLENCNDKIKAAKNAGDIDNLKLELDNLLAVIEDDCKLMDQYQKELKG